MTTTMKNKCGLVLGVANERSIAWGIAKVLAESGADIALSYQNENLFKRVSPLAEKINSKICELADVQEEKSLDFLYDKIKKEWGKLDFLVHALAYSDKEELTGRFINSSRGNFLNSMDISCYSFVDLARRSAPLMKHGGSLLTVSFMGGKKVTPSYNVMGPVKAALESSVRYLANDLGPEGIRVNAISPGPMKTLAGAAIGGARQVFRGTEKNAPLRKNADLDAVGKAAMFLVSDNSLSTTGEIIYVDGGYHVMGLPILENL
ncbi:MAG: enoyl-[acyl-carrier-protein] reductase FabI [Rhodobacteraceae bacterium]|nr:enoyl-[acyl-carrier-protein] reductase FabI [Paracoccaceae bacterium]|tara:strand:+ start:91 stop:879 length:789 start_codon:yes stop_codon:yes gene_type:complete